jgi:hypothetical protein
MNTEIERQIRRCLRARNWSWVRIKPHERWDSATGGDPLAVMIDAQSLIEDPNVTGNRLVMFSHQQVYEALATHPDILDLYACASGKPDRATPEMIGAFVDGPYLLLDDVETSHFGMACVTKSLAVRSMVVLQAIT